MMSSAAQRDCRKTPGSKNVQKNLPQQAKKIQKYFQNVVQDTKNQMLLGVYCIHQERLEHYTSQMRLANSLGDKPGKGSP
jgi:hypothetical protein